MTFATHAAKPTLAAFFYVRISGLPYIFSSRGIPPDWDAGGGTVTIDSETYTWSDTILTDDAFASISHTLQLRSGMGAAGGLNVDFIVGGTDRDNTSDVWLDLLNNSVERTDTEYCTPTDDLDYAATDPTTTSNSAWPSSGNIYASTETIAYTSKPTSTTFGGVTRARFGSKALYHVGTLDGTVEAGAGGVWASNSLVLQGRIFEVWLATGEDVDGVFVPNGASPMTVEDWNVYTGEIDGEPELSKSLDKATVKTSSLERLLLREVAGNLPKATAGVGGSDSWAYVVVDDSCNKISWSLGADLDSSLTAFQYEDVSLIREVEATPGTSQAVPDGVYHHQTLAEYVEWTIRDTQAENFIESVQIVDATFNEDRPTFRIIFETVGLAGAYYLLTLHAGANVSLWRSLGFEGEVSVTDGAAANYFHVTSPKKAPSFYWRANNVPRRLYYHDAEGPAFNAALGLVDDDGTTITAGAVKIGNHEVCTFTGPTASTVDGSRVVHFLECTIRNEYGSRLEEDVYVEWEPEPKTVEITQGLAFKNVSALRMFLYLALSVDGSGDANTTYDKLPRGAGAAIDEDHIDITAVEALDADRLDQQRRNGWAIFKPTKLRDIMRHELVMLQMFCVQETTAANGSQLTIGEVTQPDEDEIDAAHSISHANVSTWQGNSPDVGFATPDLINVIVFRLDYDTATGKWLHTKTFKNATSIATWGERAPLKIDVRGIQPRHTGAATWDSSSAYASKIAQAVFAAYSWPYKVVELNVTHLTSWALQLGEAVSITHDLLPAPRTVGRGWSNVLGRLYAVTKHFKKQGSRARLTVISRASDGRRVGTWSPGASLTSKSSNTSWTAAANAYTRTGNDLDDWSALDVVRCYTKGDEGSSETATIATASGTAITFDAPGITLSAPVEMVPDVYGNVVSGQKRHVYIADDDNQLGTGDAPYRWK